MTLVRSARLDPPTPIACRCCYTHYHNLMKTGDGGTSSRQRRASRQALLIHPPHHVHARRQPQLLFAHPRAGPFDTAIRPGRG